MKKKTEIVNILDELRSQDPKKRLASVQSIKQIATALGPQRARTQFIQYLTEFIDDEQHIVLELLTQLQDFAILLGGEQHEKTLLPLLISFCKTDEKKQSQKATQLIQSILLKNKDLIIDVVKKLYKTDMNTSKEAAIKLISNLIHLVPQSETQLMEIYSGMVFSQNSTYKIIASRHLSKLLESMKNKQQVSKLIEVIYNDNDDLPKMYALEALVNYYTVNSNLPFSKFKALFIVNNWRVNIKICQIIPLAAKVFSKAHFKSTFEPNLIKFLNSTEPQLRCKACLVLKHLASVMTEQDIKSKLIPILKKLSADPIDYVKIQMSENIVGLIQVCSASIINDEILPIIFSFIKSNELAVGIVKNFEAMTKKLSTQVIEQKILTPLISQFNTQNWRIKCQLIELLGNVINSSLFLNDKMTTMMVNLTCDRINAVRQKATQLIINIICQQSPQWCDNMLLPKLIVLKESTNYIERQILLQIIEKTCDKVSDKTLNEIYKPILVLDLSDKIPNVRAKALRSIKACKKLCDKNFEKLVERLKNDTDAQVREVACLIKV